MGRLELTDALASVLISVSGSKHVLRSLNSLFSFILAKVCKSSEALWSSANTNAISIC